MNEHNKYATSVFVCEKKQKNSIKSLKPFRYFTECCEYGLELAIEHYKEMLPHFYSKEYHEQKVIQSNAVLSKYGRGKSFSLGIQKLSATCEEIWLNGRQQCEFKSLRGNPCVMPMHETTGNETIHNSGETIVSTCNCGRTQGIRVDPYLLRQANYEFYRIMMTNCTACPKLEAVTFPVFEPSSNEYRYDTKRKIPKSLSI